MATLWFQPNVPVLFTSIFVNFIFQQASLEKLPYAKAIQSIVNTKMEIQLMYSETTESETSKEIFVLPGICFSSHICLSKFYPLKGSLKLQASFISMLELISSTLPSHSPELFLCTAVRTLNPDCLEYACRYVCLPHLMETSLVVRNTKIFIISGKCFEKSINSIKMYWK